MIARRLGSHGSTTSYSLLDAIAEQQSRMPTLDALQRPGFRGKEVLGTSGKVYAGVLGCSPGLPVWREPRRSAIYTIKTQGRLFSSIFPHGLLFHFSLACLTTPWQWATLQSLVAAGCRAVVGSAACGNATLLAATSRPRC